MTESPIKPSSKSVIPPLAIAVCVAILVHVFAAILCLFVTDPLPWSVRVALLALVLLLVPPGFACAQVFYRVPFSVTVVAFLGGVPLAGLGALASFLWNDEVSSHLGMMGLSSLAVGVAASPRKWASVVGIGLTVGGLIRYANEGAPSLEAAVLELGPFVVEAVLVAVAVSLFEHFSRDAEAAKSVGQTSRQ